MTVGQYAAIGFPLACAFVWIVCRWLDILNPAPRGLVVRRGNRTVTGNGNRPESVGAEKLAAE